MLIVLTNFLFSILSGIFFPNTTIMLFFFPSLSISHLKPICWITMFLITLLGLALRVFGLISQSVSRDDIAVSFSAWNYVKAGHLGPTMWNHPNLRKILVYFSMNILGSNIWGLKINSLLFGTLSVFFTGMLAKNIFKNNSIAYLAAFLLAVDSLHIDFSRQAVHEVYMLFFFITGIFFFLKFLDKRKLIFLVLSGILFGLGISSKWYVVFPLITTYLFCIYQVVFKEHREIKSKLKYFFLITSTYTFLPLTIYLLTYIPWFSRGFNIIEWFNLQKIMLAETITHSGYIPYGFELDHKAFLWFIKPVAFADFVIAYGKPKVLLAITNPLVWLLTIPAILFLIFKGCKENRFEFIYLSSLFIFSYLPFLLTKRPIWSHTAFAVLPYALMAISYLFIQLLKDKKYRRSFISIYLLLVIVISIPLYLLSIGKGLEIKHLKPLVEVYRPDYEHQ